MENVKIAAALCKAQKAFAPALKSSTNPHFKSKYVALDGCIEAVIDALNGNGIYLMQKTHDCETGVKVETVLLHESGESFSGGILHVPAAKNDPQGYGSALTYARRYSLMATCGIAPEDDDGNTASQTSTSSSPPVDLPKILLAIEKSIDMQILQGHFSSAWTMLGKEHHPKLKAAYDKRKAELLGMAQATEMETT